MEGGLSSLAIVLAALCGGSVDGGCRPELGGVNVELAVGDLVVTSGLR